MTAVRLAPGDGYVFADSRSLLFLPTWDEKLAAAFTSNAEGARRQAVASAAIEAGFELAPFVCVTWLDELHLMVFGQIEVETTAPALPMLTGAGSRTWVERAVDIDHIDVDVCAGAVDPRSRLVVGTVLAGGFRLELRPGDDEAGSDRPAAAVADAPASSQDDTAAAGVVSPSTGDERHDVTEAETEPAEPAEAVDTPAEETFHDDTEASDPSTPDEPEPEVATPPGAGADDPVPGEPSPEEPPGDLPAPTVGTPLSAPPPAPTPSGARPKAPPRPANDPQLTIDAIRAAAVGDDGAPLVESESQFDAAVDAAAPGQLEADVLDDPNDADITLPPPQPVDIPHESDDSSGARVEAKPCQNGHLNPPSVASCEVCGELLSPDASSVVHAPRPSLGVIQLDDGTWYELTDELLLGRNPAADAGPERTEMRRVKTPGDKVSRVHVEVRLQGWDVLVGDCGSTNGTFVVPHSGGNVLQLEPGRLHIVEEGATVYFGSRSFHVIGRRATS